MDTTTCGDGKCLYVAGGQLTVSSWPVLVPPLEQPRSPVLPAGVRISMLKPPAAGIAEDGMVTVSWVLLTTVAAKIAPLKITSEEETKWLPFAVMMKGDGLSLIHI